MTTPVAADEVLFAELLWIHNHLREGLASVRDLAVRVATGAPAGAVRDEVDALARDSALWRLRANCMYQCRFVHGHHGLEDAAVFPAVRAADPGIASRVDQLEADHRVIAGLLLHVERAADGVAAAEPGSRPALVDALNRLSDDLTEHLDREETLLRPVLRRMGSWAG